MFLKEIKKLNHITTIQLNENDFISTFHGKGWSLVYDIAYWNVPSEINIVLSQNTALFNF